MWKQVALLLLLCMVVSITGCASQPTSPAGTEALPANTETLPLATTQAPSAEPETQPLEGNLYLKVSSITFSVVGESEDVYLGMVPRELVSWHSENPAVIDVQNGVLTATGVGTTTVHASYQDRRVSCVAGCLASDSEELAGLDPTLLSAPKRLPPEVNLDQPCQDFDHSAILGDSITYFLWQYENEHHYLGKMTFVSRHGISIHCLVNRSKNMYFEGHEMNIEDIAAKLDATRIYILLGCLDFQVPASAMTLMEHWEQMLDLIQEKVPDKEIIIISNIPSYTQKAELTPFNANVAQITVELRQLAADRGCGFLDLGYYIQDHYGRMPADYSQDEFHMGDDGLLVWTKLLRFYAQYEAEGGTLA